MSTSRQTADLIADTFVLTGTNTTINNIEISACIANLTITSSDVGMGDVLIVNPNVDRQVIKSDELLQESVGGIACKDATSGTSVPMAVGGEFQVKVNGVVTRGDFLATSSDAGISFSTGTLGDEGDFAIALESSSDVGIKLIYGRFNKTEVF